MATTVESLAAQSAPATLKNYINGQWVASTSNERLVVPNPATEAPLAYVPLSNAADVQAAVDAARAAAYEWGDAQLGPFGDGRWSDGCVHADEGACHTDAVASTAPPLFSRTVPHMTINTVALRMHALEVALRRTCCRNCATPIVGAQYWVRLALF